MTAEDNKATFLRFVSELNRGNLRIIDEVCSPTFAFYSPSKPDWPHGLEGARKIITTAVAAIPDLQSTIEDIFAEGDKVALTTMRDMMRNLRLTVNEAKTRVRKLPEEKFDFLEQAGIVQRRIVHEYAA
jgi:predicted ester cyclase